MNNDAVLQKFLAHKKSEFLTMTSIFVLVALIVGLFSLWFAGLMIIPVAVIWGMYLWWRWRIRTGKFGQSENEQRAINAFLQTSGGTRINNINLPR